MHRIHLLIVMGFFSTLFGCNKPSEDSSVDPVAEEQLTFVSESGYKQNRAKQITMAPQTMEQLRGHGVTDDSELKLEYFFYTDSKSKAESLAKELAELGYDGGHDVAAGDPSQFVITGWTIPMKMSDEIVVGWTAQMCDVGQKFDCEFDGWGTNPNQ